MLGLVANSLYRLVDQLKKHIRDWFKVGQYIIIIFAMVLNCIRLAFQPINKQLLMFWEDFHDITLMNYAHFQSFNLLCWIIMIIHLKSYQRIDVSKISERYRRTSLTIIKFENILLALYLIHFVITNLLLIFVCLAQLTYTCEFSGQEFPNGKYKIMRRYDNVM